jgi:hypothetical protein
MPEVAGEAGFAFHPESAEGLLAAIYRLEATRDRDGAELAQRCRAQAGPFTWTRMLTTILAEIALRVGAESPTGRAVTGGTAADPVPTAPSSPDSPGEQAAPPAEGAGTRGAGTGGAGTGSAVAGGAVTGSAAADRANAEMTSSLEGLGG